ncbi:cu(2+) suppressing and bleomycin sensitive protein 1 [[Candida] jaroonii]|uniref:Cu(2+) suppressing and bleomycin sensitive protein 1 n=1 Tax=[Candida] jaroonii TaxID=467808 RepID=A0ACA9Y1I2_9ASCO|nr:cu(2+) suppressing and bleomycin sensitive protein 1 [[Candida] jaroonii]
MKLPDYEKSIHHELQALYKELLDLKNNRSQYINSNQIYHIYNKFLNYLNDLSIIRKDEEIKGMKLELPNSNDSLIDDIWQLISLCFITCGLTKFAPATYSSLSTVYKLLLHLKDGKLYTDEDLKPINNRLQDIKTIIEDYNYNKPTDKDVYKVDKIGEEADESNGEQINYIRKKYNKCQELFNELNDKINQIPDDVKTIYYKLLSLRKNLINLMIEKEQCSTKIFEDELKNIEHLRDSEGSFTQNANSQIILNGLLDDCNNLIKDINIHKTSNLNELLDDLSLNDDEIVNEFKTLYKQLCSIKLVLENLLITRRWTLRETDLYNYQNELKNIESKRKTLLNDIDDKSNLKNNLKFKNFQILLLYLLRRCYSLIYKLLESSEPVSESLQPIHNQLQTVRRCLLDIKRIDGLNNLRELYPFQFKLASLDNLRNDGRFIINNQIPEGQGTLNALLAECFDIMHELKIELESKEEEMENDDKILTDDEDINSDDEVELKRNRYVGFNEADYDQESESEVESEFEYEANDYY